MHRLFLLAVLFLSATALAQNAGLDRRFGERGIASLRDPSVPTNYKHIGLAACAAPDGNLNVVVQQGNTSLALFRVLPDGNLDTHFSGDGFTTVTVPLSNDEGAQGACMADGRILVLRQVPGVGNDRNFQLTRLMPDGTLDAGFGAGSGYVTVDMDTHTAGLGDLEFPLGLNIEPGGSILVSLRVFLADGGSRPGLARFTADGTLIFARTYLTLAGTTPNYATAAGMALDGKLWLFGGGNPTGLPVSSWFRAVVDALTGDVLQTFVASDGNYVVDGGRILPSGIMIIAAKYVPQSEPGGAYRPRLLVVRDTGTTFVALPSVSPMTTGTPTLSPFPGAGVAIPIGGDRVLQGSPIGDLAGEFNLATYAAVVQLGATAAEDRVDVQFGNNGRVQFAYRTETPCANGAPTLQNPVRFSNWRGRPVLAGVHSTDCTNAQRNAFASRLLAPEDIFGDSFD
ncbi:hypothetical protein [Tahibacter amnicola]|uniref:Delta-60 repeat protein n=1 Tax=Tahibacter amnicola TaxID=2976241 RepID=A0ABY6BHA2_9GAMM|nr:hypothetical protein [Tahibacter amnicola]UXI69398.1 hypothetical protein N4264_07045 [Tahibacter amnicola]